MRPADFLIGCATTHAVLWLTTQAVCAWIDARPRSCCYARQ